MPNNRHLVDNNELVHAPLRLERGWTAMFGFGNEFVVDEGRVAVITEGGAYIDTLFPGTHALSQFAFGRELKAIFVETRELTLTVSTAREFTIARPVPVTINLDLAVTYRVSDFRRVACEIKYPVTELYDRVIKAVRSAVAYATYDEVRIQGEGIAATTLERLRDMGLPTTLGIEVLNVNVVRLQALDTAGDALATQAFREYTTVRDWMLDNSITANARVTWPWLVQHRPEIAQELIKQYGNMAEKMIESGALDTTSLLNRPTQSGTPQFNPLADLGAFGLSTPMAGFGVPDTPERSSQGLLPGRSQPDFMGRMREEIELLNNLPNARVEHQSSTDQHGLPDGFAVKVSLPLKLQGLLTIFFACSSDYPSKSPNVELEVDGESVGFTSEILRRWSGQYLIEIVREARKQFEY